MLNKLAKVNFDIKSIEQAEGSVFAGKTIGVIVESAIPYIFTIAGMLFFIYLIAGGFSYMTSAGDPKATKAAQTKISHALIGLMIVLLSFLIVQIFGRVLGINAFKTIFG